MCGRRREGLRWCERRESNLFRSGLLSEFDEDLRGRVLGQRSFAVLREDGFGSGGGLNERRHGGERERSTPPQDNGLVVRRLVCVWLDEACTNEAKALQQIILVGDVFCSTSESSLDHVLDKVDKKHTNEY